MKRDEIDKKLATKLEGFDVDSEALMKIGDSLSKAMREYSNRPLGVIDPKKSKSSLTITRCINGHLFGFTNKDELLKINGRRICDTCFKAYNDKYVDLGVAKHSTFEEFVESQVVLGELVEED